MSVINWGIVGLGNIAHKFADGFKYLKNSRLKGISSKDDLKLNYFKNKHIIKDEYCFKNYNDLIQCPDIDIIYLALPNNLHFEWINQCINAKKNILVEKPALIKVKEALDIKNKLSNSTIYFTEAFMYKFCPHIQSITNEILKGSIGEITHMNSNFSIKTYKLFKILGFTFKKPDFSNRLYNKDLGGGSILDLGCYPLSLSNQIANLKKPISKDNIVIKNIKKNICESNVEISASCKIEYDKDFYSEISCSFENNSDQTTIIYGKEGNISLKNTWQPHQNSKIKLNNNNENKIIDLNIDQNIYSYEINEISNQLLNSNTHPEKPALNIDDILLNTSIMNYWINNN